jgi:hypothetical protein
MTDSTLGLLRYINPALLQALDQVLGGKIDDLDILSGWSRMLSGTVSRT